MQWHSDDDDASVSSSSSDADPGESIRAYVDTCLSLRELVTQNRCQTPECIAFKLLAHKANRHRFAWQMALMHRYIANAQFQMANVSPVGGVVLLRIDPAGGSVETSTRQGVRFPLASDGGGDGARGGGGGVQLYAVHVAMRTVEGVASDWHNALLALEDRTGDIVVLPFDRVGREALHHCLATAPAWESLLSRRVKRVRVAPDMEDNYRAWLWLHVALSQGDTLAPLLRGANLGSDGAALFELHVLDSLMDPPPQPPPTGYERRMLHRAAQGAVEFLQAQAHEMPPYRDRRLPLRQGSSGLVRTVVLASG